LKSGWPSWLISDGLLSSVTVQTVSDEISLPKEQAELMRSQALASFPAPQPAASASHKPIYKKNWDGITEQILSSEKPITSNEDPNAGGDSSVNKFFQDIYGNADDNTRRAMMKSFTESGGTTLSTNWDEVGKGPVEVKPPTGSEWKKWN